MSKDQVAELLKPRYKVIADWPNNTIEIGDICTILNDYGTFDYGERFHQKMLDAHPHLFKKLEWWEDRKKEEMPDYVIQRDRTDSHDQPLPDLVLKVKKHFSAGNGEWRDDSYKIFASDIPFGQWFKSFSYSGFEPATESEYLTFINSSKQVKQ